MKRVDEATDEKLFENYRGGDRQAFVVLIKRYEKELYNFLLRFLGKPAIAEEVFQETFLQVHVSAASFDATRQFRPWLYTIAANKARDTIRHRARRPAIHLTGLDDELGSSELWDTLVREETTPEQLVLQKEMRQAVRDAVERMPDSLKEILILAYFNQLQYKEIAQVLSVPLGTVKSRLHAAVAAFSKQYRKTTGEGTQEP